MSTDKKIILPEVSADDLRRDALKKLGAISSVGALSVFSAQRVIAQSQTGTTTTDNSCPSPTSLVDTATGTGGYGGPLGAANYTAWGNRVSFSVDTKVTDFSFFMANWESPGDGIRQGIKGHIYEWDQATSATGDLIASSVETLLPPGNGTQAEVLVSLQSCPVLTANTEYLFMFDTAGAASASTDSFEWRPDSGASDTRVVDGVWRIGGTWIGGFSPGQMKINGAVVT